MQSGLIVLVGDILSLSNVANIADSTRHRNRLVETKE
jgi:hypothetical protein